MTTLIRCGELLLIEKKNYLIRLPRAGSRNGNRGLEKQRAGTVRLKFCFFNYKAFFANNSYQPFYELNLGTGRRKSKTWFCKQKVA
jgi:hypothetical protein